jgi:protein disulfide-isomerase A6
VIYTDCKTLAPTWDDLAGSFKSVKDKVTIAKLNADEHRSLGQRFGVQGFPTLKWFDGKSDKPEDYNGGRGLEDLQSFISEKSSVRPKTAAKAQSDVFMLNDRLFNETVGQDKNVLVAFTASWCGREYCVFSIDSAS